MPLPRAVNAHRGVWELVEDAALAPEAAHKVPGVQRHHVATQSAQVQHSLYLRHTNKMPNFVSSVPGQMMDEVEEISIPLMLITLATATLSFLISLSWATFVNDSVTAVQHKSKHKLPLPVARLLAAIVVTAVAIFMLVYLYNCERKATRANYDAR